MLHVLKIFRGDPKQREGSAPDERARRADVEKQRDDRVKRDEDVNPAPRRRGVGPVIDACGGDPAYENDHPQIERLMDGVDANLIGLALLALADGPDQAETR